MTLASPVAPAYSISMRIASTQACLMPNPTCCTRSSGAMTPVSPTHVATSLQLPPSPPELALSFNHPISGSDASTDSHRYYQHSYSHESSSRAGLPPVAIRGSSLLIHWTSHCYNTAASQPKSRQKHTINDEQDFLDNGEQDGRGIGIISLQSTRSGMLS